MSTFPTLREANIARQAEWAGDVALPLTYKGNELAGEVGEACNIIKKLERERIGIAGSRATVEQLAQELADVVICADLIAIEAGFDVLPWSRAYIFGHLTISACGNRLGSRAGAACAAIEDGDFEALFDALVETIAVVQLIASTEGIDLKAAVEAKFNATSDKVGLKTRLAA